MKHFLALMIVLACATRAGAAVIVQDGQPRALILTAAEPSESAQRAAKELQHYVKLMSGAELSIYAGMEAVEPTEIGHSWLLVGRSDASAKFLKTLPAGDDLDHTRETFMLKTAGRNLIILGNEDSIYRGTEYAVYDLLERLGCRWFFPGEFGQVIPQLKTIVVPELDVEQSPSFIVRNIWMSGWADRTDDHPQWLVRNKGTLRGGFAFPGDGTIWTLAPPEKYADEFPEIYAMGRDGVRHGKGTPGHLTMLCVTNPKTVEIAAETIKQHFRDNPQANSYGFSAPDGSPRCLCDACVAADHAFELDSRIGDSISDAYFNFVNNVTHEVTKEFPDRYVIVLSYANRVRPPEGLDQPWSKNVIVHLARLRISTQRPIGDKSDFFARRHERTLDAWARIAPRILIYDYDPHADLSRMPCWKSYAIRKDMPFYKAHNVIGFTTEAHNTFLRTGLNYYLRAKLMWNVEADVDALLADFYAKFFGPAAGSMKAFIEGVERMAATSTDHMSWTGYLADWTGIYPRDKTAALAEHLDMAETLADTDAVKTHVRAYRAIHDYMLIHQGMLALHRDGKYAEALAELERLAEPVGVVQAIQPGLLPPDPGWVVNEKRGLNALRGLFQGFVARSDGPMGRRLALAPAVAQFRTDPHNDGLFEQWHIDAVGDKVKWDEISITRDWSQQGYRDEQGYPYDGFGWYRFKIDVPEVREGEVVRLFSPFILAQKLWIWANGHLVWSPTKEWPREGIDIDVTRWLKPGAANTFTYRMIGTRDRTLHYGLVDRPLLWAAKTD